MIIVEDNVVFESREAIEARVKEKWAEKGFNVSFEPYSVAQRLCDVFTDLLYQNQETVRDLYSRLSLQSTGADLDRFVQKLDIQRLQFPMLAFVWKNSNSSLSDRRFTYLVLPVNLRNKETDSLPISRIRYRVRGGQGMNKIEQNVDKFEQGLYFYEKYEKNEKTQIFNKPRKCVLESEIFDIEINKDGLGNEWVSLNSITLFPHKGIYQSGKELKVDTTGSIEYRNSDTAYYSIYESDEALRSRIITKGLSVAACETMLNKICERSRVDVQEIGGEKRYKVTMIGFDQSEEKIRAFWDICYAYLPEDFVLMQSKRKTDKGVILVDPRVYRYKKDKSEKIFPAHRSGYVFFDNPSRLYIVGLTPEQEMAITGGLPSIVTYQQIYLALGSTFSVSLLGNMEVKYRDRENKVAVLSDNKFVSSQMTWERGEYFKPIFTDLGQEGEQLESDDDLDDEDDQNELSGEE